MNDTTKERLAEQLHLWYLEACQKPESGFEFNPKAQEPYEALPEGSKFLDRYLAEKILGLLSSQKQAVVEMIERQKKELPNKTGDWNGPDYRHHYRDELAYNAALTDILNAIHEI